MTIKELQRNAAVMSLKALKHSGIEFAFDEIFMRMLTLIEAR